MFTHEGYIIGCDMRTDRNYRRKVKLRETKTMFVSETGERFCKKYGLRGPGDFPKYRLESQPILLDT